MRGRFVAIAVAALILAGAVYLYIADYLAAAPETVPAAVSNGTARLTLQTVASYGHAPAPDWVSYLAQDPSGHWRHSTIFSLPAHTRVTVTIYQFDTATGLRNPFLAQIRGTEGGTATINGKPTAVLGSADDASHTFTVPDIGLSVPLPGVPDDAKNPCSAAPCTLDEAHNTITFSFMTPGPGNYRWQCFVPCALKAYFGNGGPMSTIGWMSGRLLVT